ncbi:MAG: phosphodiester glycosidase family protein [Methylococcales bacterium]
MTMLKNAICISLVLLLTITDAFAWWTENNTNNSFKTDDGLIIKSRVLEIDMQKANLRIVSVPFETDATELSLRDFGNKLIKLPEYKTQEWIAVNGGFSSYSVDIPVGLLISDGRVLSTETLEKNNNDRYRWNGILCQHEESKQWEIFPPDQYHSNMCRQGIQATPILVSSGSKVEITSDEPERKPAYVRTVICITRDSKIKVILTEKTHLLALAIWLAKSEESGGIGCDSAINLSGYTSSGIAIKSSEQKYIQFMGEGLFPIPSALIFKKANN